MKVFAFDVGNGFVKAKNEKRTMIAPSCFAKEKDLGESTVNELEEKTDYQVYKSTLDQDNSYVWGNGIKDAVEPDKLIHTYTHEERYEQKRFKLLAEFILAELASDFDEAHLDVTVVTGLPSKEIKSAAEQKLRDFFLGNHVITRNGKEMVVNVKEIRILEQPLGTLLNLYMNDNGKIHKDLKRTTISVLDFGAGTTILDTYKNMKRIQNDSKTYYQGMNDVYTNITNKVQEKHDAKSLDETMIEDGIRDNYTITFSARKKIPFKTESDESTQEFVEHMISNIDRTLTNRDHIDKFIITGGGSQIVGQQYKKAFGEESLEIVENSQFANVDGFFKFAQALATKG
ncbi:plasmid segregation protein ParM (plasmid) [Virgibacillus necropolis]|uniref:ParM/StbA family protein n=1 Tax=Virgibacillus necropolis TaxID=163877 RepID=UPI0038516901